MFVVSPDGVDEDDRRVFFDIHGGGYVLGGAVCAS
jgi:acetyl esterase/lipase